jgi:sterol desaturase/sphingolipid hydroxylase (fatty acid hydroxylase superfamily)
MDNLLFYITPIIVLIMIFEYSFVRNKPRGHYEFKDTTSNIIAGLGLLLERFLFASFIFFPYVFFYKYRIFTLEKTWWVFLLLIFLEDYAYYWFHRISHESRLFWSAHETHHSSQRYNFSTAVRQTWTGYPIEWLFWIPLVFLGFPPEWVILQKSISLFYQLFIHTESVNKLGFIEKFMNTPSHHRVHHAININYLDKNYAGIFIIWDKIHGTFIEETETPIYGTLDQIKSYNPLVIAFHTWIKLARDIYSFPGLKNKLKAIFYAPGWRFDGAGNTTKSLQRKAAQTISESFPH